MRINRIGGRTVACMLVLLVVALVMWAAGWPVPR
jgi:hypothetical protein